MTVLNQNDQSRRAMFFSCSPCFLKQINDKMQISFLSNLLAVTAFRCMNVCAYMRAWVRASVHPDYACADHYSVVNNQIKKYLTEMFTMMRRCVACRNSVLAQRSRSHFESIVKNVQIACPDHYAVIMGDFRKKQMSTAPLINTVKCNSLTFLSF